MNAVVRSGPPKQMLVVSGSPVGTYSMISPSGEMTVIPPLPSVATQTLPSPSTASESSSWKPGRPARQTVGSNGATGASSPGADHVPPEHPAGVGLGPVHGATVGRQADAVGRVDREAPPRDRRAVGPGVVDAGHGRCVRSWRMPWSVNQKPPCGVEHEVVGRPQRLAVALGVEVGHLAASVDRPAGCGHRCSGRGRTGRARGSRRRSSGVKQPPLLQR